MFRVDAFGPKLLSWWHSKRSRIDMEPPYQRRGRLWSDADKAYLIDSILNGFDVPKLYIADFTWGDSPLNVRQLPYAIIDGKQRFEAIFDFYDGLISLNPGFQYIADPSLVLGGLGYVDLRENYPEIAEDFDNYNLSVMAVITDNEENINELFVRLNRSKPLTGAEIRNAMKGAAPEVFRNIAGHEFFTDYIKFQIKRGQDLNAAAKLVLWEFEDRITETKKSRLDSFVRESANAKKKLELAGRRVIEVLDVMTTVFLPSDILLASSGVLPIYYWVVRNRSPEDYSRLREFLVRFEEMRRENRALVRDGEARAGIDPELTDFDNYNRSTNDEKSHVERYRILMARFTKFLKTKNK